MPASNFGSRILRTIGDAAQVAGAWLHKPSEAKPAPAVADSPAALAKGSTTATSNTTNGHATNTSIGSEPAAKAPPTSAVKQDSASSSERKRAAPDRTLTAKAKSFEQDKPTFVVKKHPDLAPAYGVVDAAKKFAEANLPKEAQDEFVGIARRHVMQKIISGEHVKGPQIYLAPAKSRDPSEHSNERTSEHGDLGKAPRSKEVAKER